MANDSKTILLVEDNELMLKVMSIAFEGNGYTCMAAASPHEAFRLLQQQIPDIILSDYEMPGMNGFEFRQALINDEVWKDIPFVFYTNYSQEVLMMKGLNMNALDYIIKGTPVPAIISKLDNIIHSIRSQHERTLMELRNAAKHVNAKTISDRAPQLRDFRVGFWHQPFQNYPGGDFIDFIRIDDRYCFCVLGDVMGKKWTAWFFAISYLSYIRAAVRFSVAGRQYAVIEIVKKINEIVLQDATLKDVLAGLSLLLLDSDSGEIHYCGAGDLPLVHYRAVDATVHVLRSSGVLLGLQQEGFFDEQVLKTMPGDQVLLFTDGLIDILSLQGKRTDYTLFVEKIKSYFGTADTLDALRSEVLQQLNTENQLDDASIIFIERNQAL